MHLHQYGLLICIIDKLLSVLFRLASLSEYVVKQALAKMPLLHYNLVRLNLLTLHLDAYQRLDAARFYFLEAADETTRRVKACSDLQT